jgi:hypothetical protein
VAEEERARLQAQHGRVPRQYQSKLGHNWTRAQQRYSPILAVKSSCQPGKDPYKRSRGPARCAWCHRTITFGFVATQSPRYPRKEWRCTRIVRLRCWLQPGFDWRRPFLGTFESRTLRNTWSYTNLATDGPQSSQPERQQAPKPTRRQQFG